MCRRVLLRVKFGCSYIICTNLGILVVELFSTATLLCPSQNLYGTILMPLCLIVWNWRVLKVYPMPSYWPNLVFIVFLFLTTFYFFSSVGWLFDIRVSDEQSVPSLSLPCTADSFIIIMIITINIIYNYFNYKRNRY